MSFDPSTIPDWVEVTIAVAVCSDGRWRAEGDWTEHIRSSMEEAVQVADHESGPAHVYILSTRLRVPSGKIIKPKVEEP